VPASRAIAPDLIDREAGFDLIRVGWDRGCDDRTDRDDEYRNYWKANAKLEQKQRDEKETKEIGASYHKGCLKRAIQ
jgi:hypothetical protein